MINIISTTDTQFNSLLSTGNRLVCICTGDDCFRFLDKFGCHNQVEVLVDSYKAGQVINVGEKKVKAINIGQLPDIVRIDDIIVLTSLVYADEIIPVLDEMEKLDGYSVFIPALIRVSQNAGEEHLEHRTENRIPKIIHYCWFGENPMPQQFLDNVNSWKSQNPDFQIKLWNEQNYDVTKNSYMQQAYLAKKWGFVPDFARLDIIYNYGGVYMDVDVEAIKPLDQLLGYDFFAGFEEGNAVAFGLGFGAIKGNPIIAHCMEVYENEEFIHLDGSLNLKPSPLYQTESLESLGLIADGRTQTIAEGIVLSSEYLAPLNALGNGEVSENTFSIHHYAATWYDDIDIIKKRRKMQNFQMIIARSKDM